MGLSRPVSVSILFIMADVRIYLRVLVRSTPTAPHAQSSMDVVPLSNNPNNSNNSKNPNKSIALSSRVYLCVAQTLNYPNSPLIALIAIIALIALSTLIALITLMPNNLGI